MANGPSARQTLKTHISRHPTRDGLRRRKRNEGGWSIPACSRPGRGSTIACSGEMSLELRGESLEAGDDRTALAGVEQRQQAGGIRAPACDVIAAQLERKSEMQFRGRVLCGKVAFDAYVEVSHRPRTGPDQ